jgi:glutamate-1-semialdehyde 2,1-aminomutase
VGDVQARPDPRSALGDATLADRAHTALAYGGHHRMLLRAMYEDELGVFPEFAVSASGYEVVSDDGRTFIDWTGAWGPVLLGYRHPRVEEAIRAQLEGGPLLSLSHPVEVELAEAIIEMVPCAEMVAFGKNGSDVTTAAVRLARAATGRDLILHCGFHGFHDWYTCKYRAKNVKGIPKVLRAYLHEFPYGDLDALEWLFARYPGEVAAVIMEPVNLLLPEPGYLEEVAELARQHGALLVFDEVVTGFRLANGGAQELFGVTPDLACLGKGLANGMPLSVITGRREFMEHLPDTAWGMTFRGETLSLAAGLAVTEVLRTEPVVEHLAEIGSQVREGFREACERAGVAGDLLGPPARMSFQFEGAGALDSERLKSIFVRECARHGVLTTGTLLPTYAHDESAVDSTVAVFKEALEHIAESVKAGRQVLADAVGNGFTRRRSGSGRRASELPAGSIDLIREHPGRLEVEGWLLLSDGPPDVIEVLGPGGEIRPARPLSRPDVGEVFPGVANAAAGGFRFVLPASVFAPGGDYEFTIRARRRTRTAFRCSVVRSRTGPPTPSGAPRLADDGTVHA